MALTVPVLGLDRPLAEPACDWPAAPGVEAYHGLAGDVVRAVEPHTEADPVAILVQFLVAFGNLLGRNAHRLVGATPHYSNEFLLLVGSSGKSRKGTSWDLVEHALAAVDPDWAGTRVHSGLTSGEGLVWHVRDSLDLPGQTRIPTLHRLIVVSVAGQPWRQCRQYHTE